jgi:hypothetical protein
MLPVTRDTYNEAEVKAPDSYNRKLALYNFSLAIDPDCPQHNQADLEPIQAKLEHEGTVDMLAILSIALAVGLLGLTVYGLHRYQNVEVEYRVDRSMPLPPLENEFSLPGTTRRAEIDIDSEQPALAAHATDEVSGNGHWQQEVTQLKQCDKLEQAFIRCQDEFPLWSAYNQACIILRAQLKPLSATDPQLLAKLVQLFRLAATAELLHAKSTESEHLTLGQLRQLDLQQINALNMAYSELGYAQLRLIRKNDIKLMQSLWGRPQSHKHPRQLYRGWWAEFTSTRASNPHQSRSRAQLQDC